MLFEQFEVEVSTLGERLFHIRVQVQRQQTATVVGAKRDFAARVGGNGAEPFVAIAVRQGFSDDGVPKQHARFGGQPGIVDNLFPKRGGLDFFGELGLVGIDGELLAINAVAQGGIHEGIVDAYRNVGTRNFTLFGLGVDKVFGIGMLDGDRQHQRTAAAVLGHFAGTVRIPFHKRNDARRG